MEASTKNVEEMIITDALEEMIEKLSANHENLNNCLKDNNICPICKNTGWEQYEQDGYTYCRECKCGIRQKKIMNSRLSFANIPKVFENVRMNNFNKTIYKDTNSQNKIHTAVKAIEYWLDNFETMQGRGMGLYLYSETKGSGKTRMAVSIANELIYEKHIQVKFSTSLQILNEIKSVWNNKENEYTEDRLLDFLCTSSVLIVDDFGLEQGEKSWIKEKIYHIINSRYVEKRIIIFTSNIKVDLLGYDERIIGRIKESTFQIPFPEENVRDIMAKENLKELSNLLKEGGRK